MRQTRIASTFLGLALGGAVLLGISGCSSSDSPPADTPEIAVEVNTAEPVVTTPEEEVIADAETVIDAGQEVDARVGGVAVSPNEYFMFPKPIGLLMGDYTAEDWQWEVDYDKTFVTASVDLTVFPENLDTVAMGDAESGQIWLANDETGEAVITYSYVDPELPTVKVEGVYTVTIAD